MLSAMRAVPPRRRYPDGRLSGPVPGKSVYIVPGGPHRRTGWMGLVRETAPASRLPTFPCSARYDRHNRDQAAMIRSEEHTSELQSLMRISYAVFCLKKKKKQHNNRKI